MAYVDFYHYTSETNADAIIESGVIRQSLDGGPDAMHGTGVYGTKLPPTAGKKTIAKNNWRQGWRNRERRGQTDYVFKIQIPSHTLLEFTTRTRHIYLYKGELKLDDYQWELLEV